MDWGDVPTWAAIVISVLSAVIGIFTKRSSKAAEERAEQALVASQSSAQSTSRMADSLGELVALAAARANDGSATDPRALSVPAWNIEYRTGSGYLLRNVGTGTAHRVVVDAGSSIAKGLPGEGGVTIEPGQGHEFLLIAAFGAPIPSSLEVTCAELGPQHVAVPAKLR